MNLKIKRAYDPPHKEDGTRILIDRLWPRGLSKERASIDLWLKEIAPSTELRQWFDHDPDKWDEFKQRYLRELQANDEPLARLKQELSNQNGCVTLLYAAKDSEHNNAVVLQGLLSG